MPGGRLRLRPLGGGPLGAVSARGLRIAGASVDVAVDRGGSATVSGLPAGLTVSVDEGGEPDGEAGPVRH